jgi:8-oxo-dGTP pyrophosphatase MutT (NUDIX family)
MPLAPAAVSIILSSKDDEVLLVQRRDVPVWVLPGGGIDSGEPPEEAVKREVFEETGYRVAIIRQTGEYYPINRLAAFTSVFLCRIEGGEPHVTSETASIAFFPIDQLPVSLFLVHRDWLNDALNHSNIVKKSLTQVTYWAVFKHFAKHPMHVLRFLWTRLFKK